MHSPDYINPAKYYAAKTKLLFEKQKPPINRFSEPDVSHFRKNVTKK